MTGKGRVSSPPLLKAPKAVSTLKCNTLMLNASISIGEMRTKRKPESPWEEIRACALRTENCFTSAVLLYPALREAFNKASSSSSIGVKFSHAINADVSASSASSP